MLRATTLKNQPLFKGKHVFFYTYSRAKPHDDTHTQKKKKKLDYDKSRRKHQNKVYNTSSNKMLTLGIGVVERSETEWVSN